MVEYNCLRCNKTYDHKGAYDRHMQRKNPCKKSPDSENDQRNDTVCEFCKMEFACNYNLKRHLNGRCKSKKEKEMQIIIDKLHELEKEILVFKNDKKTEPVKKPKKKNPKKQTVRKAIPKAVKLLVWDKYIGPEKGIGNCFVCNCDIDSKRFDCGHIISSAAGGTYTVDNLRCVCSKCNNSVYKKDMLEFKKEYFNENCI